MSDHEDRVIAAELRTFYDDTPGREGFVQLAQQRFGFGTRKARLLWELIDSILAEQDRPSKTGER